MHVTHALHSQAPPACLHVLLQGPQVKGLNAARVGSYAPTAPATEQQMGVLDETWECWRSMNLMSLQGAGS